MTCPKDGGTDIATFWHADAWADPLGDRDRLGASVQGEHLHRRCQSCGYNWADPTLDAPK